MELNFVTTNKGKYEEVKALFDDFGIETKWIDRKYEEDTDDTIEETAKKASRKLADELGIPIVLEDTGLFFEAYDGFPGPTPKFVYKTLGYKGIFKLLDGVSRKAYFQTFVAYCKPRSEPVLFSGEMKGEISTKIYNKDKDIDFMPYDRIFIPEGKKVTISDMSMKEKNSISQRSKAFTKLAKYLTDNRPLS